MYRKDFLQRQIEEFGKVMAGILTYKGNLDWEKFEQLLEQASLQFVENDLQAIEDMADDAFANFIQSPEKLNLEKKKILATLLFEKLNFYLAMGITEKYQAVGKRCVLLYLNLKENQISGDFDLDLNYKLESLAKLGFDLS